MVLLRWGDLPAPASHVLASQGAVSKEAARCLVAWLGVAVAGDAWLCVLPSGPAAVEDMVALLPQALGELVASPEWGPCLSEALAGPLRALLPAHSYLQCLFAARHVLPSTMWEELCSGWDEGGPAPL